MRRLLALGLLIAAQPAFADDHCANGGGTDLTFPPVVEIVQRGLSAYETVAPVAGDYELHVVSSYEGSGKVLVGPTDKPVVLVLASYEPSRWQAMLLPGSKLERVILLGFERGQRVTGLPATVAVESPGRSGYGHPWQRQRGNTKYVPSDFKAFIAEVRCRSGLAETSFQYAYNLGQRFHIPPLGDRTPVIERAEMPRVDPPLEPTKQLLRYEVQLMEMAPELRPAGALLVDLMRQDKLPVYMPSSASGEDPFPPEEMVPLLMPDEKQTYWLERDQRVCGGGGVVGTEGADTLECAWGNQWYALGAGGDVISDGWNDDLVLSGSDDDIISLGWGNDIVVFQSGWGDDVVDKTCHGASMLKSERARLGWPYPFKSFLIFGEGIRPELMAWRDASTIEYTPTGDIVTLAGDCFTLVFSEPGTIPERPAAS